MNWLEILLAFQSNINGALAGAAFISLAATIIGLVILMANQDGYVRHCVGTDEKRWESYARRCAAWFKMGKLIFRRGILATVIFTILACIPTVDSIWKVRIGLIKLQLASPANVQKSANVIERIGHELECKYLGCEQETK